MPITPINITDNQNDETNVDWYADGERANALVLNRPIKQVSGIVNEIITSVSNIESDINNLSSLTIKQPSILSPTDGEVDFKGNFTSSTFETFDFFNGWQDYVEWQVSDDSSFTNIVSMYSGNTNFNSWPGSPNVPLTTYWVRVRYGSDKHISQWSEPVQYTTIDITIQAPTFTVEGEPDNVLDSPRITASEFTVFNAEDVHESTSWVVKVASTGNTVWSSLNDTVNKTSIEIPDDTLSTNTTYIFEVTYNGETYGSSGTSQKTITTPETFIQTPDITPTDGSSVYNSGDTVRIVIDGYDSTLPYIISATGGTYTLDTDAGTIYWDLPTTSSDVSHSLSVYSTDGTFSSDTTTISVTVVGINIIADDTIQSVNYIADAEYIEGYIIV